MPYFSSRSRVRSLLFAVLYGLVNAPQIAYAHNFIPDGHATILTRISPFAYALFTLVLLTSAGALVGWYRQRQQQGLSVARIPLLLALLLLLSMVASCRLSLQRQAENASPPISLQDQR